MLSSLEDSVLSEKSEYKKDFHLCIVYFLLWIVLKNGQGNAGIMLSFWE